MVLGLAGHGDEPHVGDKFLLEAGLGAGDANELLVGTSDRRHETSANLELLKQRTWHFFGWRRCEEDRVIRGSIAPALVAVADPELDILAAARSRSLAS